MDTSIRLADAGWVWDGQGINGLWKLSIFGAGEGTRWFGLNRVCHMFHPSNAVAIEKLAGFEQVICEISKWEYVRLDSPQSGSGGVHAVHDGTIARKVREAETVSRLSCDFRNLTGAIDDDLYGKIKNEHITPDQYAAVPKALKQHNRKLKLWGVVYTHELKPENWRGFEDLLDVVNLWVWNSKDLFALDEHIALCRAMFPGKPINLGCYLRDYTLLAGVPMDRLEFQWRKVLEYLRAGQIVGYSIIGGFLIDWQEEQARWVRDFIKAH